MPKVFYSNIFTAATVTATAAASAASAIILFPDSASNVVGHVLVLALVPRFLVLDDVAITQHVAILSIPSMNIHIEIFRRRLDQPNNTRQQRASCAV
jgi:hypothetical protein